jgi:hypothetical protein
MRGGGSSAARQAIRSSGSSTMCVVPSRYGVCDYGRWTATLIGCSLSDELTYVSGVIDLLNTSTQALSALQPREWAINLTYRFP